MPGAGCKRTFISVGSQLVPACGFSPLTTLMVAVGVRRACVMCLHPLPLLGTSHWVICNAFVCSQVVALGYYSFHVAQNYFYSLQTADLPCLLYLRWHGQSVPHMHTIVSWQAESWLGFVCVVFLCMLENIMCMCLWRTRGFFVKCLIFLIGPKTTMLRLAVKFFPPDPGQLQEEYTR